MKVETRLCKVERKTVIILLCLNYLSLSLNWTELSLNFRNQNSPKYHFNPLDDTMKEKSQEA